MSSTIDLAARLSAVVSVQQEILSSLTNPQAVLERAVRRASETTGGPGAAIELLEGGSLMCQAAYGPAARFQGQTLPLTATLSVQALRERAVMRVDSVEMEPRADATACRAAGVRSMIIAPLLQGDEGLGAMSVFGSFPDTFADLDVYTLQLLAGMTVGALMQARMYQALQSSEERYRLLFERNVAGVFHSTRDGRILDVNDALVGYLGYSTREELLSQSTWNLYQQRGDREALLARLESEHGMTNVRLNLKRKDGSPVHGLVNIVMIPADGDEPHLLGTMVEAQD